MALLAVRRGEKAVSGPDFQEAIERIVAGLEKKNRLINERERRIVAYHEIGHALVGLSLPGAETVQKITIVPRAVVIHWTLLDNYRAISAVADGMKALANQEIADELGAEAVARAKAFGKFAQGLAHANLALFYDMAFVVTEDTDLTEALEPLPYTEVMTTALGMLDEAIALCGTSFTIPFDWMASDMDNVKLAKLIHWMKARYMAELGRTPAERAQANWNAIISEIDAGLDRMITPELRATLRQVVDNRVVENLATGFTIGRLENTAAEITDADACSGCRVCEWLCPDFAIRVWTHRPSTRGGA